MPPGAIVTVLPPPAAVKASSLTVNEPVVARVGVAVALSGSVAISPPITPARHISSSQRLICPPVWLIAAAARCHSLCNPRRSAVAIPSRVAGCARLPLGIGSRKANCTWAVSGRNGVLPGCEEDALAGVSAAADSTERGGTVEASVDTSAAVPAPCAGLWAFVA